MSTVTWTMKLYDVDTGNPVTALSYDSTLSASEEIRHAFNRQWTINLNSYDQLDFTLYLDDPMAAKIKRGKSVVKLFRDITDVEHSKSMASSGVPSFCGVVGYTEKSGQANTMNISCYSPLWRLQFHFHILNHYLETNPNTAEFYTQSELMWRLIELTQEAFPAGVSSTGIFGPDDGAVFSWGLPDEPQPVPYFVGKGSNTWSNIFDDLMNRPSSPDIVPRYTHADGNTGQMFFDTDEKRGVDVSTLFNFYYHTANNSPASNCDDVVESVQLTPGGFANYLWVTGSGGPNTGRFGVRSNASSGNGSDGYGEIGIYMANIQHDELKRFDAFGDVTQAEFLKRKHPIATYTISLNPVSGIYYGIDFALGDVAKIYATRGALNIAGVKQRIYQATLAMSLDNIETCQVFLAKDFYGKVETA